MPDNNIFLGSMAKAWLTGNDKPLMSYLPNLGLHPTTFVVSPVVEDINDHRITLLNDFWMNHVLEHGELPDRQDVRPEKIAKGIGFINLVDLVDDGRDMRMRLYGTKLAGIVRRDLQGSLYSEIWQKQTEKPFDDIPYHMETIRLTCHLQKITYGEYATPPVPGGATGVWRKLMVPLGRFGGPSMGVASCIVHYNDPEEIHVRSHEENCVFTSSKLPHSSNLDV